MHKIRFIANIVIVSLILSFILIGAEGDDDENDRYTVSQTNLYGKHEDYTEEGEETSWQEDVNIKGIASFKFSLTWEDEQDSSNHENQPDSFRFTVDTPWGEKYESETRENQHGEEMTITLEHNVTEVKKDGTNKAATSGEYSISVFCEEAGDQRYTGIPLLGSDEDDDGNEWEFTIEYKVWKKV